MNKDFTNFYNNLVHLTRNKNIYKDLINKDSYSDRLIIFLFHFAFFLNVFKSNSSKKSLQDIFDHIFKQLETSIREIGYGDASINKKMKDYINIFYSILDKMFYFIPDEATLTCRSGEGDILEHGRNYSIKVSGERLYLGVPPENARPLTANLDPAEFPVLEIQPFSHEGKASSDKTPRPTVV